MMNPTKDEILELFITEAKKEPRWKNIKFGKLEDGGTKHFVCYRYHLESFEEYSAVQKKYEPLTKAAIQRDHDNEEEFIEFFDSRRLALTEADYKADSTYEKFLKDRNLKTEMIDGQKMVKVEAIEEDYPAAYEECFASVKPDEDFSKHEKVREVLGASTTIQCYSCKGSTKMRCGTGYNSGAYYATCFGRKLMKCKACAGTGNGAYYRVSWAPPFECPTCKGKGKVRCTKCRGSGQVQCGKCSGIGRMREYMHYRFEYSVRDSKSYFQIDKLDKEMLRTTNGQSDWWWFLYEICGGDCSLVSGDVKFYNCKPKLKPLSCKGYHSCKGIYAASVDYIKEHAEEMQSANKKLGHTDENKTEEGKNIKKDGNLKKQNKSKQVRNVKRKKRCGLRNGRKNNDSDENSDASDDDSSKRKTNGQLNKLKFGTDGYPLAQHRMLKQRHWVEEIPVTISVFHLPTKRTIFKTIDKSFVVVINGNERRCAIKETVLKDREWNNPCSVM